jgi:hypothetical protein
VRSTQTPRPPAKAKSVGLYCLHVEGTPHNSVATISAEENPPSNTTVRVGIGNDGGECGSANAWALTELNGSPEGAWLWVLVN